MSLLGPSLCFRTNQYTFPVTCLYGAIYMIEKKRRCILIIICNEQIKGTSMFLSRMFFPLYPSSCMHATHIFTFATLMWVYMQACMHACLQVGACMNVYMYACMHVYLYMHVFMCRPVHACVQIYVCIFTYICTHACMNILHAYTEDTSLVFPLSPPHTHFLYYYVCMIACIHSYIHFK